MVTRTRGETVRKTGRCLLGVGIFTGLLGFGSVAWAQQQEQEPAPRDADADADGPKVTNLDSVVVTARKREELVQDVPMSISVVAGDRLQRGGDSTFRDIGRMFAGVSFNDSNGPEAEFRIRGLTSPGSGSDTRI